MSQASVASGATLHLVLGATRVDWTLQRPGQATFGSVAGVAIADDSTDALWAACDAAALAGANAAANGPRARHLRVLVADSWLASSAVPWSDELRHPDTAGRYARSQLEAAGYVLQADDTVRLDDGPYGQPRMAVAYPTAVLAALQRVAQAWGAELQAVVPLSAAAWRWSRRQGHRDPAEPVLVWGPGCLLVLQGSRHLAEVLVRGLAFGFDDQEVQTQALAIQWQRMCFRNPALERVTRVQGISLWQGSPAWSQLPVSVAELPLAPLGASAPALLLAMEFVSETSAVDAVRSSGRAGSVLQKALAICLLLTCVAFGLATWQHWRTADALAQQMAEQSQRNAPVRGRPSEGLREDPARIVAVNAAIRELNMPVSAMMRALQAPRDLRVALLSVDVAAAGSSAQGPAVLKIVAEARSGAEMARYVSHISGRQPLGQAYLTRHEVQETNPEQPYRFVVEAQWMP